MTDFGFSTTQPATGTAPSQSQPIMLLNNVSTNAILAVDHITFNNAAGGQHLQVTFNTKTDQSAPSDPTSIAFTAAGSADTNANMYFINQSAQYLISCVRAFGVFTIVTSGSPSISNGYNIASISVNLSNQNYTITLDEGATNGTNVVVLITQSINTNSNVNWSFAVPSGSGVLTLKPATLAVGNIISFAILQA